MKNSWLRLAFLWAGTVSLIAGPLQRAGADPPSAFPPVITSPTTAQGLVGSPFSYQITATGRPDNYGAQGLPAGLTTDPTSGVISGQPLSAGTFPVTLSATNGAGTGTAQLMLTINPAAPLPPVITSASSAQGTVGTSFSYQIAATNNPSSFGAAPLPAGLAIDQLTGIISGTPAIPGTTNTTLSATNGGGTGTAPLAITINSAAVPPPAITSPSSAQATAGTPFTYQITATNNPTSFNAAPLPPGLTVDANSGLISGTPGQAGSNSLVLSATNSSGTGSATLALTVNPAAAPGTPVLNGNALSDTSLKWSWSPVPNATAYQLLDQSRNPITGPLPPDTVSVTETGLAANTAYTRILEAFNGSSQNFSNPLSRFTLARPPTAIQLSGIGVSSVNLSWSTNGDPSNTSFRMVAQAGSGPAQSADVLGSSGTLGGLAPGTTYFLQVLALNGDGLATAAGSAAGGGQSLRAVTLAASVSVSVANAAVFPNPFRPARGDTQMTFAHLPPATHLTLYTILGEKVREIDADSTGMATWDGNNSQGQRAASGVYFVLADGGGDKKVLKVAVQR